jgi:copper resistance protein C
MKRYLPIGVALTLAFAPPALAHPRLTGSTPAPSATVRSSAEVSLTFSERLLPRLSGVEVAMTGMPRRGGHPPIRVSGLRTSVGADGRTLITRFARPLAPGTYRVDWHVVSADTHRINGTMIFSVG